MRRPLIVGNWKMNTTREDAITLAQDVATAARDASAEIAICPPFPWIVSVAEAVDRSILSIGAQDCSPHDNGAFTGDVSATMLAPWCDFVLVGHSERRTIHGETDEIVGSKVKAVIARDLRPVLCIGEHKEDRDAGNAIAVITGQLGAALSELPDAALETLTVAYEPVWAIGTGVPATADDTSEMAEVIRSWLRQRIPGHADAIRLLYGGSVSDSNAAELMALPELDGLLVGSASLDAGIFGRIVAVASA
jgi:triosephosphate isomerase